MNTTLIGSFKPGKPIDSDPLCTIIYSKPVTGASGIMKPAHSIVHGYLQNVERREEMLSYPSKNQVSPPNTTESRHYQTDSCLLYSQYRYANDYHQLHPYIQQNSDTPRPINPPFALFNYDVLFLNP